jgi:acyl carrier protein
MNKENIIEIIRIALEIDSLSIDDSSDNIEEWDSLGQLSILSALDKETNGKASSINGLSEMFTVREIVEEIKKL